MGGKPTSVLFNQKFICIGEDHDGDYAFKFDNSENHKKLLEYIDKNDFRIKLWYEGVSRPSKSFDNFKRELLNKED